MKRGLAVCMAVMCLVTECRAWGFYGHQLINYQAVFLLPPEMMVLYKANITFLTDHAVDPDKRRYAVADEGPRHYIDMDSYGAGTFASPGMNWREACNRFTEDTLKAHGIVPWWIDGMLWRLTAAFKKKDLAQILKLSAEIGHYIGDAHVPLHASSNHNGQKTDQHGIHGFWETRIPELLAAKEWDFWLGSADYISRPLPFIWRRVHESAAAADSVLSADRILTQRFPANSKYAFENRNGILVRQYSEAYSLEYNRLLAGMIERRMRQSIAAVASFWYTAWVNAGQPDCSKIVGVAEDETGRHELEELNRKWREGKIAGKACD